MDDVGLARGPVLALVLLDTERPCAADEVEIVLRTIAMDGLEEVIETSFDTSCDRPGRWSVLEACGGSDGFDEGPGWFGETGEPALGARGRRLQSRFEVNSLRCG
jgi:hypothetical protein